MILHLHHLLHLALAAAILAPVIVILLWVIIAVMTNRRS